MSQRPDNQDQAGLTLIELMIAMVILGVVIAAAFNVSYSLMANYRDHRRAMAVERSARGAITVLADAVRNASPGVPAGQINDLVGCTTSWKGIYVEDHTDQPDALSVVYAAGGVVTSLRDDFTQDSTQVVVEDASQLAVGDQVLITDFDTGTLVPITAISQSGDDWYLTVGSSGQSAKQLCSPGPANFDYAKRALVLRARVARFYIDTGGAVPVLMMDPDGDGPDEAEAMAEGVEDLQVAIGVDRGGDGSIDEVDASGDDDDWVYNNPGDTVLPNIATQPYRAIRLTVTARSVGETSTVATSIRPPAEDRDGASVADEFKRRSLSTTIEIRNLSGSP